MILAWFAGAASPRLESLLREEDPDGFLIPEGMEPACQWLKTAFPDAVWLDPEVCGRIHNARIGLDPVLIWNGQEIIPYRDTVCFLNTRTGDWTRKYLDLFPDTESDPVRDCSEFINTRIEELTGTGNQKRKKS